jgi:hypothetical protein
MRCTVAQPKDPYSWVTNPPRHARFVSWLEAAHASARAQWIGIAIYADLLTSASQSPVTTGLGAAGTHGPEGQAAFSCGRPLSAAPTALADKRRRGLVSLGVCWKPSKQ